MAITRGQVMFIPTSTRRKREKNSVFISRIPKEYSVLPEVQVHVPGLGMCRVLGGPFLTHEVVDPVFGLISVVRFRYRLTDGTFWDSSKPTVSAVYMKRTVVSLPVNERGAIWLI